MCLTAIEVTADVPAVITWKYFFDIFQLSAFKLWGLSLSVAILLKILQHWIEHSLLVPIFYMVIPALFYLIIFSIGISIDTLRKQGWLFQLPQANEAPFWTFWTYFNFPVIDWRAIAGKN